MGRKRAKGACSTSTAKTVWCALNRGKTSRIIRSPVSTDLVFFMTMAVGAKSDAVKTALMLLYGKTTVVLVYTIYLVFRLPKTKRVQSSMWMEMVPYKCDTLFILYFWSQKLGLCGRCCPIDRFLLRKRVRGDRVDICAMLETRQDKTPFGTGKKDGCCEAWRRRYS